MMIRRIVYVLALLALPAATSAQSLFTTRGLGTPMLAADARALALGGVGVGLLGFNLALDNPADIAGVQRRGASATMQPSWNKVELDGASADLGGTRFPMVRVVFPATRRLTASLSYSSYLDQNWAVPVTGEEVLGNDTIGVSDLVQSLGGIAQLRMGFAYQLTESLVLGAGGGIFTGSIDRSITRSFEDSATFDPFETHRRSSYSGPLAIVGARWDPIANVRIGGSAMFGGDLKANSEEGDSHDRSYGAPRKLSLGASAMLATDLMVNGGVSRETFPSITNETETTTLDYATTQDTWHYGAGVEYTGLRTGTRVYPFRAGFRSLDLPYAGAAEAAPKETAFSFGTGFVLATDQGLPQAMLDLSLERGSRTGLESAARVDGLREKFWRMSVSLSLFGR